MGFSSATHNVADETKPVMFTEPSLPVFAVSICLLRNTIGDCSGIRRDGHLLFEIEMYLQKGCIIVSGVGSS